LRRGLNFEVVVLVLHDGANCRGLQRAHASDKTSNAWIYVNLEKRLAFSDLKGCPAR
jgi:hypothetical protein